jgi:hypothetical protein
MTKSSANGLAWKWNKPAEGFLLAAKRATVTQDIAVTVVSC